MAGDWIKLEHATLDKPEIAIAAEHLEISHGDAFLLVCRYWVWLDQNLDENNAGVVPFVSRKSLERMFNMSGFAAMLEKVGWASFDDRKQTLSVTHWERHNGKSAKSRALDQRKKAIQRGSRPVSVPMPAGLEKRREEVKIKDDVDVRPHKIESRSASGQKPFDIPQPEGQKPEARAQTMTREEQAAYARAHSTPEQIEAARAKIRGTPPPDPVEELKAEANAILDATTAPRKRSTPAPKPQPPAAPTTPPATEGARRLAAMQAGPTNGRTKAPPDWAMSEDGISLKAAELHLERLPNETFRALKQRCIEAAK